MSGVSWVGRRASIGHTGDQDERIYGVVVYGPVPKVDDPGYFTVLFQPNDKDRGITQLSSKFFSIDGFRLEPGASGNDLVCEVRSALALPEDVGDDDIIKEIKRLRSIAARRMG